MKDAPAFLEGRGGHVDLPRAKSGGLGGGFFAIYVPSPDDCADRYDEMRAASYDLPLPSPLKHDRALPVAIGQTAILLRLEQLEALKICRNVADIRNCLSEGKMAAIMHLKGAEAIDPDLHALRRAMRAHGYDEDLIEKLCYRNWLRLLEKTWEQPQ